MIRTLALAAPILLAGAADGVRVEGRRRINLVCIGAGSPTVVLTAGAGATAGSWRAVQAAVARRTRSCAWDRAGFGLSDASPRVQSAAVTTRDLERALSAARVAGPLLLVGHSVGAYETLLLADRHRVRLAGLVLADPSIPDMFRRTGADPAALLAPLAAPYRACAAAPVACRPGLSPAKAVTAISFFDAIPASARAMVDPRRSYGRVPLIVLTAGPAPARPTPLAAGHAALAALSARGVHRYVADSGHMMHRDRPDAIVAAIEAVLDRVRLPGHTPNR